ncbi:MAG: acetolactate synthase [Clostridia bacterium]|nr:acetolactate synthase [Clostridia bacterium]
MFIKQLSVFLENNPGTLKAMTELLGKGGVDLLALSLADTQSFGIVRLIIHSAQMEPAMKLLKENGYIARVNHVICASVPDRPLGLSALLGVIDNAGLSVEYMYSFFRSNEKGRALMILRLNDGARAAEVFAANDVMMLSQDEVDRL